MRENRTYGSEGGENGNNRSPTPIQCCLLMLCKHSLHLFGTRTSCPHLVSSRLHCSGQGCLRTQCCLLMLLQTQFASIWYADILSASCIFLNSHPSEGWHGVTGWFLFLSHLLACILGNDALASSYLRKSLTFTLRMVEHARPPKW